MMKKLKNVKLLLYICLAMFLLNSCTEEKEYLENNNPSRYKIKDYTFKEANRIAKFSKVSSRMGKNFSKLNTLRSTNAREGETDFVIDESVVKEISIDDYTSYTMKITREEPSTTYFENLVIEMKDDSTFAYIIKYTPTDGMESLDEHMHSFEGTIEASKYGITSITGNGGSNNLGASDGSNATSSNTEEPNYGGGGYSVEDCVTIMLCNYVPIGSPLSNPHIAYGSQCQPYPVTSCSSTGWGTTTLGTNPTGTGPSGGQMGSGTNTVTETSNPITVPILNNFVVDIPETPCEQIEFVGPKMKTNIDWLKTKTNLKQTEFGVDVKMKYDLVTGTLQLSQNQKPPSNSLNIILMTGDFYIGSAHSHPIDGISQPSYQDLDWLVQCYDGAYLGRKEMAFSMVVSNYLGENVVYCLKVDNITTLRNAVSAVWNDPKYAVYTNPKIRMDEIHDDQTAFYDSNGSDYEKSFLEYFNNFGVSLYKATDDSLQNWSKLELVSNPSTPSTYTKIATPCNF